MIVFEAALAISMIGHPRGHVFMIGRPGCVELAAAWAHWPCLFPQHGPGPKHERPIELAPWQERIVEAHPDRLLRGLIQSDGCRCVNRVRRELSDGPRWYAYPRYMFSNNSEGIRRIFCRACDRYGVRWRRMKWNAISIARKEDVAHLDLAVGPKA